MSRIDFASFETYHIKNPIFTDAVNNTKNVRLEGDIEISIERDDKTGEIILKNFSLNSNQYLIDVEIPLYGKNGVLTWGSQTKKRTVLISGIEIQLNSNIEIKISYLSISGDIKIHHITVSDSEFNTNGCCECKLYYLGRCPKLSDKLNERPVRIENTQPKFTISCEKSKGMPENLDILTFSYSMEPEFQPPTKELIKCYSLILGFFAGGPVSDFGYTIHDESGKIIRTHYSNPRRAAIAQASIGNFPPFDYDVVSFEDIPILFGEIIDKYNHLPIDSRLSLIMALLHRLWDSYPLYLDEKVLLVISGIEIFLKKWCDERGVKETNTIIDKEELDRLLNITQLKQTVKNLGFDQQKIRIINENLGSLHISRKKQKIEDRHTILGLGELKKCEKDAIDLRHKMIHETPFITDNDEDIKKHLQANDAAITMCYRLLLTYLGYSNKYPQLDYYEKNKDYSL